MKRSENQTQPRPLRPWIRDMMINSARYVIDDIVQSIQGHTFDSYELGDQKEWITNLCVKHFKEKLEKALSDDHSDRTILLLESFPVNTCLNAYFRDQDESDIDINSAMFTDSDPGSDTDSDSDSDSEDELYPKSAQRLQMHSSGATLISESAQKLSAQRLQAHSSEVTLYSQSASQLSAPTLKRHRSPSIDSDYDALPTKKSKSVNELDQLHTYGIKKLTFFDLETTGLNLDLAQIVQLCFKTYDLTDHTWQSLNTTILPLTDHWTKEAEQVHKITKESLEKAPLLRKVWPNIFEMIKDSHVVGYNITGFDLFILENNADAQNMLMPHYKGCIDLYTAFKTKRISASKNLSNAYQHYTGKTLINMHNASVDTEACVEILRTMITREEFSEDLITKPIGTLL